MTEKSLPDYEGIIAGSQVYSGNKVALMSIIQAKLISGMITA